MSRLAGWLDGQRFADAAELFTPDITNVLPQLEGDRATVTANVLVTFVHPDGARDSLGGRYTLGTVRTGAGWRIDRLQVDPVWGGPGVSRAA